MSIALTVAEQQKLSVSPYVNLPKTGRDGINDITVDQFHAILSSHSVETRCTFLAFHVTPNSDGKTFKTHLEMNNYNAPIYDELSPECKIFVDNTISGKEQNQFKVAASGSKVGMFTTLFINKGTDDEPSWGRFDNVIVNVSAGRFTIKNEFESTVPKRVVVSIKNNNKMGDVYKPFLANKKLDNVKLNECYKLLQEGFAFEMSRLKQCYLDYQKLSDAEQAKQPAVRFYDVDEIHPDIFRASCLDGGDAGYGSMYRRCRNNVTMDNGKPVFEPVPYENEEDHFVQIRLPLSGVLDKIGMDKYNKWTENIFNKRNIRVMAPFSQFNYRWINSEAVGVEGSKNSILEYIAVPTLHKIEEYSTDNDRPQIHLYRQADVNMTGNKALHPMFTQYTKCNNQSLNMVINFDCFVNDKNFVISSEIINFRPIYNVRLENKRFSNSLNSSDDGDNDISGEEYGSRQSGPKSRSKIAEAIALGNGGDDIDMEEEPEVPASTGATTKVSAPVDLDDPDVAPASTPVEEPVEAEVPKRVVRRMMPKPDNAE